MSKVLKKSSQASYVSAEQDGTLVTIFLSDKAPIYVEQFILEKFIENTSMNSTDTFGGNEGNGEPWNDNYSVSEKQDPAEYLDQNFDHVCEQYFLSDQWVAVAAREEHSHAA